MYPQEPPPQFDPAPLRIFGTVLILLGVALAALIVWYVHLVLTSPDALPMIVSLMPHDALVELKDETKSLVIPREVVRAVAYVVFALVLGVLGGLARTLISAGAGLLKYTAYQAGGPRPKATAGANPHID